MEPTPCFIYTPVKQPKGFDEISEMTMKLIEEISGLKEKADEKINKIATLCLVAMVAFCGCNANSGRNEEKATSANQGNKIIEADKTEVIVAGESKVYLDEVDIMPIILKLLMRHTIWRKQELD